MALKYVISSRTSRQKRTGVMLSLLETSNNTKKQLKMVDIPTRRKSNHKDYKD